jgi:two-component system, cell cycle response regulator
MTGRALIVDDNRVNRMLLRRGLQEQGIDAIEAENGAEALEQLAAEPVDVVLLDLLMPVLDGYETLARIKADETLRHLPVIVITAVEDIDSVVRCIDLGATDYLPKPFNAGLLRARVGASLAAKRLRDLELEYLEQVGHVIAAATSVEEGGFDTGSLAGVAERDDALGTLARVFGRMADEVRAREERLKAEVRELRIEIDEQRQARKVAEITDSDYFKQLRSRAQDLRRSVGESP